MNSNVLIMRIKYLFFHYSFLVAGLHLRSIEEPATTPLQFQPTGRMNTEQGGTGYGGYGSSEHSLLIATRHAGVPLPLAQHQPLPAHYQPLNHSGAAPPSLSNGSSSSGGGVQTSATPQQQQQYQVQQPYQYQYQHHYHHQANSPQHHRPYDPEHARMEAWLDENQEFVQDYFIRQVEV